MERQKQQKKCFMLQKSLKKSGFNDENIDILKLIETEANFKYLIEAKFDKTIRPLVWIMLEMGGCVKTFKFEEGNKDRINKLMSFPIDDEKLLEKYKTI